MRFLKFRANNFLSLKEMEIDFSNRGLTLIQGENQDMEFGSSNGSGKSSIYDALIYCLFDTTSRGVSGDDVVLDKVGNNCSVRGEVEVDGVVYTVTRYRKHAKFGNSLKLECGEQDISGVTIKDTQTKLEQIIGMSYKTFVTSCYLSSSLLDAFSRATDKERKQILESVVETKDYADVLQRARDSIKILRQSISQWETEKLVLASSIKSKEDAAHSLETSIAASAQRVETERARLEDQILSAQRTLSTMKNEQEIIESMASRNEESAMLEGYKEEYAKSLTESQSEIIQCRALEASSSAKIADYQRQIDRAKKRMSSLQGLGGQCPTCEQNVPDSHRLHVAELVQEEVSKLEADKLIVEKESIEISAKLHQAIAACDAVKKMDAESRSKLQDVQRHLRQLMDEEAARKRMLQDIELLQNSLVRVKADTISYEESLFTLRKEIPELKSKLPEFDEKIQSAQLVIPYLEYWETGFGDTGIRSFLFDSCMPVLNERANYYAKELTSGSIQLEFSSQSALKSGKVRDKISFSANNTCGAKSYDGNSGGEKRRIDICVMLALNYLMRHNSKVSCNCLFFDEVFDCLDSEGCIKILELLSLELRESSLESIFVISHSGEFKSLFLNRITVRKNNGISALV